MYVDIIQSLYKRSKSLYVVYLLRPTRLNNKRLLSVL